MIQAEGNEVGAQDEVSILSKPPVKMFTAATTTTTILTPQRSPTQHAAVLLETRGQDQDGARAAGHDPRAQRSRACCRSKVVSWSWRTISQQGMRAAERAAA